MGFSHPKVIEAVYNSKKYIISAVGHEVDNMLSDYAANYRAPTPSIAGEVVCSINTNNIKKLTEIENKILEQKRLILKDLLRFKKNLGRLTSNIIVPTKKIEIQLNEAYVHATTHIRNKLLKYQRTIRLMKEQLNKNDVNNILKDGFIVLTNKNGDIIKDMEDIFVDNVMITHSTGQYEVTIRKKDQQNQQLIENDSSISKPVKRAAKITRKKQI